MSSSVCQRAVIIEPGSTLGVLGSGQLGRMFALAAREMGYRVHTYSDQHDSPTGHVSDREFVGRYDDVERIREFAKTVAVVTFEFENISAAAGNTIEELVPVRPGGQVLHLSQHRGREKTALQQAGLPVTPFCTVQNFADLQTAINDLGVPGILKTAQGGYDGKGQVQISSTDSAIQAWTDLGQTECVYEQKINFLGEVSVVAGRSPSGEFVACGPIENEHRNHILDLSVYPSPRFMHLSSEVHEIARGVLEHLQVIGVMCVELFVTTAEKLLINEVAPRPHNSGHFTIEACPCSQFEQQVRAICGLPLGSMKPMQPAAMVNLLGDLWADGPLQWSEALQIPDLRLHLYGKQHPRRGRKMGHLTATGETTAAALAKVQRGRELLVRR